jgi:CHAT domain-containing protein
VADAAGRPLGTACTLERVASLTAWFAAASSPIPPRAASALVLADPVMGHAVAGAAGVRRLGLLEAASLRPLAGARREAARLVGLFGDRVDVRLGSEATEHALKAADLSGVGLLHIAAHAIVDDDRPYRSAIVLTPGEGDDGLVQMRDIVGLRLDGAIVVLAACRSADGGRYAGEGVFSLARAFLDAGASAVVANLRVLDDNESSALLTPMFAALRHGSSLRSALAKARRAVRGSAAEAAADSTIVLGNGDVKLEAAAPNHRSILVVALVGVVAVLGLVVVVGRLVRH